MGRIFTCKLRKLKVIFWWRVTAAEQQTWNGDVQGACKDKFICKWDNQRRKEEIHLYAKCPCVRGRQEDQGLIPAGVSSHSFSWVLLHTHRISSLHLHVVLWMLNTELLSGAWQRAAKIKALRPTGWAAPSTMTSNWSHASQEGTLGPNEPSQVSISF